MINDITITISVGQSRLAGEWQRQTTTLSALYDRLSKPVRSSETLEEFLQLPKAQQDKLKDVGGFVAGALSGTRRTVTAVTERSVVTLDMDNIPAGETELILSRVEGLGCGYCIYSTRKHRPAAPRLRVLIPLDRPAGPDEYEPVARKLAECIGLAYADPTTFELNRLMYWPSCSADGEFVYRVGDRPLASTAGILGMYDDWRDMGQWPTVPGKPLLSRPTTKQQDPEGKDGVVGVFCRVYDVLRAMDELIPGIYTPVDNMPDRYTYTGGSTSGGAVIYDGGKFLYSHHATDPCSGKLVNAFDLVRLHKFGDLDRDTSPTTPAHKAPSYAAMIEYALSIPEVSQKQAEEDFGDVASGNGQQLPDPTLTEEVRDLEWARGLTRNSSGGYAKTLGNTIALLENMQQLNGCARRDVFADRVYAVPDLPWRSDPGLWTDVDTTELRRFIEIASHGKFVPGKQDTEDGVKAVAEKNSFHPVRDYLNGLKWDGVKRLDTLFVDYLGVADSEYSRTVTRKALVGAVARIMTPGVKYDYMIVFVGKQGRYKSTIIQKLAGDPTWFSDSLTTFDGKNSYEAVLGKWLIEIPEMQAFDKVTMNQAKAFITKQSDFYRAAYAHEPKDHARQCIFFGTTNNVECLRDDTGGRRFWPLDIDAVSRTKNVFDDLPGERDQIWAEAVARWRMGEELHLPAAIEAMAAVYQEQHRERHPWEDTILNFVNSRIPENWGVWDQTRRQLFWSGNAGQDLALVDRTRVCVKEIALEALGISPAALDQQKKRAISAVMDRADGWKRYDGVLKFGNVYKNQRGWIRSGDEANEALQSAATN